MKVKEIITIYDDLIARGQKLQAVKFIKDITTPSSQMLDANIFKPGYQSKHYVGLKEAKDMVDTCSTGDKMITALKEKFPEVFKKLKYVKYKS